MAAGATAHDVARELRKRLPDVGILKVHKLLYYCQGWHLAWTDEPMFPDRVEAWTNGPVVADVWHTEDKGYPTPPPVTLDASQLATIGYVVSRYGQLTGKQLIVQTHEETPWRTVSMATDNPWGTHDPEIPHELMRDYFANEDEDEVALRALADQAIEDPDIYRSVVDSIAAAKKQPPEVDDLDKIADFVASYRP